MSSEQSLSGLDATVGWLDEEYFPEITLLDATCDTTVPGSVPATPITAGSVRHRFTPLRPSQLSSSTNSNAPLPQNKTLDLLLSNVSNPKAESKATDQTTSVSKKNTTETSLVTSHNSSAGEAGGSCDTAATFSLESNTFDTKPSERHTNDSISDKENNPEFLSPELSKHNNPNFKMDNRRKSVYAPASFLDFPEITLLDVTHDSELSPGGELSSMDVTHDISLVDSLENGTPPAELSGQTVAEPSKSDLVQGGELSSTLIGSVTHTTNSFGEQSDKSVAENITQDVTREASLEATQDISVDSVFENSRPSLEPSGQNVVKIQTSEDTPDAHPANVTHDISSSSAASQLSSSDVRSTNSSKNVTSELHSEPVVASNAVEANDEELLTSCDAELTSKVSQPSPKTSVNGTFTSLHPSQSSSSTDSNTTAEIPQNKTLDLPSSSVNSPKAESEATDQTTSVSKNATETSLVINQNCSAVKVSGSCEKQNATFDRHSLRKSTGNTFLAEAGAATFNLENNTFDARPKQNGTITLSEKSSSDSHQNTFDKPLRVGNATSSPKENLSQSGLPVTGGLSDTFGHQSTDIENNKASALDWDDTLDLKADSLITSTPMPNCKILITQQDESKVLGAQKKLYGDGPSKPDDQAPSDFHSSNIISDRKTFMKCPVAKSLLPPLKAASHLWKHKPASALPGRFDPLASGLPMTRQRTEALRNTAASDAPQTTGISSSYKLRPTTTGSKQPASGLQRPQLSGIPSGIQRPATGLRPPSTRSNAPTSTSTNKLRGPTGPTIPVPKTSQAKKHSLTRGEALPIAKRKKMDAPLPSSSAEVSTSSCDAANVAKNLKRPTTSKRALPAKTQRDDAAVSASTAAETLTTCSTVGRTRALKQSAASHRGPPAKPKGHDCTNCGVLEQQLKMQAEEIRRLKEELLKKSEHKEEC